MRVNRKSKALIATRWSIVVRINRLERLEQEREQLLRHLLADVHAADAILAELHAAGVRPQHFPPYTAARLRLLRILERTPK